MGVQSMGSLAPSLPTWRCWWSMLEREREREEGLIELK